MDAGGVFQASRVLAKHDENFMSPEVKAALDAAGASVDSYMPVGTN
jgi:cytochrome c-type biogenesis protein CcmE